MVISSQSHTQHVHKSMDILGEDKVNVKFFIFLERKSVFALSKFSCRMLELSFGGLLFISLLRARSATAVGKEGDPVLPARQ